MSGHDQQSSNREGERERRGTTPQQVGDNRGAGDTDGNAAAGNIKSKGAENPVNRRPEDDDADRD